MAISQDRLSAMAGYEVKISPEGLMPSGLPQRIDVFAEASTDKQDGPQSIDATNAQEVGEAFGYNSPLYAMARYIRPLAGSPMGSISTVFWKVPEAAGASASIKVANVTGTATKSATHTLVVNGEKSLDGNNYSFAIAAGDTAAAVKQKMIDAANRVIGCPYIASLETGDVATFTTGWKGQTSAECNIAVDVNGDSAGMAYSFTSTDGAGMPSIGAVLPLIGEAWSTIVVNGLGADSGTLDYLETFGGSITAKTGRYTPDIFKPFHAYTGSKISTLAAVEIITEGRNEGINNVICTAPNSPNMTWEIAADYAAVYAPIANNTPASCLYKSRLNVKAPVDGNIGDFADPDKRDQIVKKGVCTVMLTNNSFEVVDFVTTRSLNTQPQTQMDYRWVRDQTIRFNVKFVHKLFADTFVAGKIIVPDSNDSPPANSISPRVWVSVLETKVLPYCIDIGMIASFAKAKASIGKTNPNRFDDEFEVSITGIARVQSTTISTKFNFTT